MTTLHHSASSIIDDFHITAALCDLCHVLKLPPRYAEKYFVRFKRPKLHHLLFSKLKLAFSCRDVSTLDENNATYNNQMAFDILQKEFGIAPIMSARDFASRKEIDQLSVVLYLTQVHNAFTETPKPAGRCVVSTSTTFDIDLVLIISV